MVISKTADMCHQNPITHGFAKQAHTRATREATDQLLEQVTEKIVFQSQGFRIICSNLNQDDPESLEQFTVWRFNGFVEIQNLAAQKWGYPIRPTCHQKTKKDQMWLSPELAPRLVNVYIDDTVFPDHATVVGEFMELAASPPVPIWRKPTPIQWEEVDHDQLAQTCQPHSGVQGRMVVIFQQLEDQVDMNLRRQGKPGLRAQQKGSLRSHHVDPHAKERSRSPTSENHPYKVVAPAPQAPKHVWIDALQNYLPPPTVAKERQELWQSIKDAAGFPGGFANVWKHRANIGEGSPLHLPRQVDIVDKIFKDFKSEFLQLEKTLIQARCKHAKEVRSKNNNAIYLDVAQPRSLPVSTVVADTNAIVSEVSVDGLTLKYAPADLQTVEPVNSTRGPLEIHTHEPDKIVLHAPQSIEPGDHLSQPKMLGDLPDVFEAFQGLWEPMWNKHANKPVEEWSPILQEIQATVPQPTQPMTLEPITAHQWLKAVQAKPDKSAVGPDGAHKRDLLHMPQGLVQQLVDCINELASVPNRSLNGSSNTPLTA